MSDEQEFPRKVVQQRLARVAKEHKVKKPRKWFAGRLGIERASLDQIMRENGRVPSVPLQRLMAFVLTYPDFEPELSGGRARARVG